MKDVGRFVFKGQTSAVHQALKLRLHLTNRLVKVLFETHIPERGEIMHHESHHGSIRNSIRTKDQPQSWDQTYQSSYALATMVHVSRIERAPKTDFAFWIRNICCISENLLSTTYDRVTRRTVTELYNCERV